MAVWRFPYIAGDEPAADVVEVHKSCRHAEAKPPEASLAGKAKAVILVHLYGSPSQLEWVDCKPERASGSSAASVKTIPSVARGCDVGSCSLFAEYAPSVMDPRRRSSASLTHPYPLHGVAFAAPPVCQPLTCRWNSPARSAALAVLRLGGGICGEPGTDGGALRPAPEIGNPQPRPSPRGRGGRAPAIPSSIAAAVPVQHQASGRSPSSRAVRGHSSAASTIRSGPDWIGTATKGITKTLRDMV